MWNDGKCSSQAETNSSSLMTHEYFNQHPVLKDSNWSNDVKQKQEVVTKETLTF